MKLLTAIVVLIILTTIAIVMVIEDLAVIDKKLDEAIATQEEYNRDYAIDNNYREIPRRLLK